MWLMICSAQDASALWAYYGLRQRGLHPLELVTAEMLTTTARWEHTVGVDGANFTVTLADGRVINNRHVNGVVNRLTHVPLQHLAGAPDFEYAQQEYTALFMSWLKALPSPVFNGVQSQGLSGAWRHVSEWVWMAAQSGLPTAAYTQTSHDEIDETMQLRTIVPEGTPTVMVITLGNQVFGPTLPPHISDACKALARLAQTPLLGIELTFGQADDGARWTFAGATPMPDLRLGGEPLLNELARQLYVNQRRSNS
jgi:hypothetical protein